MWGNIRVSGHMIYTTTINLFQGVCQMALEAGGPVAHLRYWVAGQLAQQPLRLILNRGGQPKMPALVNIY